MLIRVLFYFSVFVHCMYNHTATYCKWSFGPFAFK